MDLASYTGGGICTDYAQVALLFAKPSWLNRKFVSQTVCCISHCSS